MACKMFSFYARIIGTPYLYETIGPALSYFIEQEYGLEVINIIIKYFLNIFFFKD